MPVLKVQKADGTYDIIQTSGLSGSEIIVSATQPAGVPDGALWLETADNEFQGTIYDEIKGDLDSMVKTRVESGEFQYYDGGWESVSIITTKPRSVNAVFIAVPQGEYRIALDVSGKGVLSRISLQHGQQAQNASLVITVDGVVHNMPGYDLSGGTTTVNVRQGVNATNGFPGYYFDNLVFKSSLKIEVINNHSTASAMFVAVDYSLA